MRIAIVQSSYIPWKGYFDLIRAVDEFVLFDDVQYTRRDWRNRNRIKTPSGPAWLTIPVNVSGQFHAPIKAITTSDPSWDAGTGKRLVANYRRAPHFERYADGSRASTSSADAKTHLSTINFKWISAALRDSRHRHETVLVDGLCDRLRGKPTVSSGSASRRVPTPTFPARRLEAYIDPSAVRREGHGR